MYLTCKSIKKVIRYSFFFVFFMLGLSFYLPAVANKIRITRIATVDLLYLIDLIKKDSIMQKALSFEDKKRLEEISLIQKQIKNMKKILEEKKKNTNKYNELVEEIVLKEKHLKDFWSEASSLMSNRRSFSENIIRSLYRIIKQEAQTQGFSLIIERSNSVIFVEKEFDLTDVIKKRLKNLVGK